MIITELKDLTQILNFEGEYALFRTEDLISAKKRGRYLFINSKNERIKLF